ncbi:MAG: hypothetical protein JST35_01415 [Armatimonadetes bacterium]|nr:hypothetical protein [Armatimonadota bacterium]
MLWIGLTTFILLLWARCTWIRDLIIINNSSERVSFKLNDNAAVYTLEPRTLLKLKDAVYVIRGMGVYCRRENESSWTLVDLDRQETLVRHDPDLVVFEFPKLRVGPNSSVEER